jgi:hypothetical protein
VEGLVTARGLTKTGKPTISVDSKLYYCGKTNMGSVAVGDLISFEASAFGEHGNLWGINSYKLLKPAEKYPGAGQPQSPIASTAPSNGLTEGERLTVSNWVAAAIAKGLVESPADMGIWASAALEAIRSAPGLIGKPKDIP